MTEEQIKIELRKINEGKDWNLLFNYIMLLEQNIHNLIAQRDEREKETIKLKKDIVKATTNWNELKKSIEEKMKELNPKRLEIGQFNIQNDDYTMGQYGVYQSVSNKMQELEQGKDESINY